MGELATELKGLLQEMVEKTALTLVPSKLMTAQVFGTNLVRTINFLLLYRQ